MPAGLSNAKSDDRVERGRDAAQADAARAVRAQLERVDLRRCSSATSARSAHRSADRRPRDRPATSARGGSADGRPGPRARPCDGRGARTPTHGGSHDPTARTAAPPTLRPFDDDLSTRLLHQRIVVLGQEVDDPIANRVCAQLLLLSAEDPRRDIALYINSPGGSISAALAMYDTMRLIPNDVSTLAMGLAASAAQFLLSAGTPGKRFALRHSRVLMHQPSGGIGGTAIDIAIQAQNMAHVKRTMQSLTAEHTGQSVETIERDADRDRWFTADGGARVRVRRPVVEHLDDVRPDASLRRAGL